ncbi:NUDIX domain-containing protein [Nocardioides sp. zg-579]|uniref:NUDIX domain-containing protein n=1 Tax=Nocardioides marmotae TaxID=2663857 RepID=A0A6I3JAP7_9ACTN|nr:NUDIX hydrolase [Nocardioides marmotae]MCR6031526.1 NUDIX domain-containing protein [Gordonia jinghuaiqii]MTB95165.1 NUDIX domain-containing protein [Nocardioides marmotae]QKE02347.1 NUDIX hydrolase [Nocardioides marmotae]
MSLHADALALLEGWAAPSAEQETLRERYVAHLRAHPDGLQRGCRPDHVTASTLVVDAAGERALLTLHAKAREWFQLGGHCEAGDTTLAGAALREATEESGIAGLVVDPQPVHLSEHAVPFCGGPQAGGRPVHHLDVRFLAVAPAEATYAVSEESVDVRWWPLDALPNPELAELVALGAARLARVAQMAQSTSSPGGGSIRSAADQPAR